MHDAVAVRAGQSVSRRCGDLYRLSPRQPFPPEPVGQRFAAQQLHHREGDAVLGSEIVNGQNV